MKKIVAIFGSALLLATSGLTLVGCGNTQNQDQSGEQNQQQQTHNEAETVMNISLNPEVEFMLDGENKVVSVNALNEDGNLVVTAEVFVGKSAEDAAQLFVEVSKDTGFIVSGNVSAEENEIEISFSGDASAANELYAKVEDKVNTYLTAENITAQIEQAQAITKEELQALVAECAPYLEEAQIKTLEYAELVDTVYQSRVETAKFYSQELKKAYYEAKDVAMKEAKLEAMKENLNAVQKAAYELAYNGYSTAAGLLENTRMGLLVNEDSAYQQALAVFREAKAEYLKYRNEVSKMEVGDATIEVTMQLETYEEQWVKAEQALMGTADLIDTQLNSAKTMLDSAYESVIELLEEYSVKANDYAAQIEASQQNKQAQFHAEFSSNYASVIISVEAGWNTMQDDLEGETSAE